MFNLINPDDFKDRPYEGGLNQLGHACFGAAISGLLLLFFGALFGAVLACLGIALFELWQRRYLGASLLDMKMDTAYWFSGAISWGALCHFEAISWGALWPWLPCVAFTVEYIRIEWGLK